MPQTRPSTLPPDGPAHVVLTGGTGFIGSYVLQRLLEDGRRVTVLARDPGKVQAFVDDPRIRLVAAAMDDTDAARDAMSDADALVHVARATGTSTTAEAGLADTLPTLRLFDAAVEAGVGQIVTTSSIAVFDEPGPGALTDDSPMRPVSIYGATKVAAEGYLLGLASQRSVRANIVRPGYTFGDPVVPGASMQGMPELPEIAQRAAVGAPIDVVRHAGLQFGWAADVARVYAAVLASEVDRRSFIALGRRFVTWEQVARWAVDIAGSASEIRVEDRGRAPRATPPWSAESIDRTFGLRFDSDEPLRAHLRTLVARAER